jgi:hypothetical protein
MVEWALSHRGAVVSGKVVEIKKSGFSSKVTIRVF